MSWKRSILIGALVPLSTLTGSSPTLLKNLPAKVRPWSICTCCSALDFELMCWQKSCPYPVGLEHGLSKLRKVHFNCNTPKSGAHLLAFLVQSFPLQFSSLALFFLMSREDTRWIKLEGSDSWEQTLAKGKQLLSIQEQAEHFSFCKQLMWDLLSLGLSNHAAPFWTCSHSWGANQMSVKTTGCDPVPSQSGEWGGLL